MSRKKADDNPQAMITQIGRWRRIAERYYENQNDDDESYRRRHPQRIKNLEAIRVLLDNENLSEAKELAAWKKIGRAVLANIDEDDPEWCGEELDDMNRIRHLLNMKMLEEVELRIRVPVNILYSGGDYLVTLVTKKGKVLLENEKVSSIDFH